jgi:CheY-like chemotaxis protein
MPLNKILLVDDDKAVNYLNRLILKDNEINCPVDEALNGQQALDYISGTDDCPDVILLDINMPGIDGFQFLDEFEKGVKCCDRSRIFILTSSIRDEDRVAALSNKLVSGYLDKPLTTEHIRKILSLAN